MQIIAHVNTAKKVTKIYQNIRISIINLGSRVVYDNVPYQRGMLSVLPNHRLHSLYFTAIYQTYVSFTTVGLTVSK